MGHEQAEVARAGPDVHDGQLSPAWYGGGRGALRFLLLVLVLLLLLPLQERRDVGQHGGQLLPLAKGPPRVQVAARGVGAFREGIPVKVVRRERSGGWVGVLAAEEGGEAVGGGAGGERGGAGAGEEEVELGVARLALVEAALVHGGEQIAI